MPVTLHGEMIKRANSRRVQYSHKQVKGVLDKLEWTHNVNEYEDHKGVTRDGMIAHFHKTFANKRDAIEGRHQLDHHLRLIHRNIYWGLSSVDEHD